MYKLLFIAIISSILVGCGSSNQMKEESFDDFYTKFHSDEKFQMERIQFPVKGGKVDINGKKNWSKSNWISMKVPIHDVDTNQFQVDTKKTPDEFYQKVWIEGSGFVSECRFNKIEGRWYLTYALDQNL